MVGSTACAITNVACGRGDGYFGAGFHIWDIAAAGLILTEAGGSTFNMKGSYVIHKEVILSYFCYNTGVTRMQKLSGHL